MVDSHVDGRAGIDAELVKRLIADQFPEWKDLPVRPVEFDGWDNRTYRLGDELTARLPTHEAYTPAIVKEHRSLPLLAPSLPVPIPESSAVIDFGTSGVGDPACDLVIAWTFFAGDSREVFRAAVAQDPATWARARGWALWKALITLAADIDTKPHAAKINHRVISEVLTDHATHA